MMLEEEEFEKSENRLEEMSTRKTVENEGMISIQIVNSEEDKEEEEEDDSWRYKLPEVRKSEKKTNLKRKITLSFFSFAQNLERKGSLEKKKVKKYYQEQTELLSELKAVEDKFHGERKWESRDEEEEDKKRCAVRIALWACFIINLALLGAKIYAFIASKSDSVLASVVDSFLDLFAGSVIFLTNHFKKKKQIYIYPAGKSRFESLVSAPKKKK